MNIEEATEVAHRINEIRRQGRELEERGDLLRSRLWDNEDLEESSWHTLFSFEFDAEPASYIAVFPGKDPNWEGRV